MNDRGNLMSYFDSIFGAVVDYEVIKIILQESQWDFQIANQKLLSLVPENFIVKNADAKNCTLSDSQKQNLKTFSGVSITQDSKDNFQENIFSSSDAALQMNSPQSHIEYIKSSILKSQKILIIMRGLPGSGKSTLANKMKMLSSNGVVLSTDDFFYDKFNNYTFNSRLLPQAHRWNLERAKFNMEKRVSPIFIDNTNIQMWEFEPYITLGLKNDYVFEFLEPETNWKYNTPELAEKCIHCIPKQKIEEMKDRFEVNVSNSDFMKYLEEKDPKSSKMYTNKLKQNICVSSLSPSKLPNTQDNFEFKDNNSSLRCVNKVHQIDNASASRSTKTFDNSLKPMVFSENSQSESRSTYNDITSNKKNVNTNYDVLSSLHLQTIPDKTSNLDFKKSEFKILNTNCHNFKSNAAEKNINPGNLGKMSNTECSILSEMQNSDENQIPITISNEEFSKLVSDFANSVKERMVKCSNKESIKNSVSENENLPIKPINMNFNSSFINSNFKKRKNDEINENQATSSHDNLVFNDCRPPFSDNEQTNDELVRKDSEEWKPVCDLSSWGDEEIVNLQTVQASSGAVPKRITNSSQNSSRVVFRKSKLCQYSESDHLQENSKILYGDSKAFISGLFDVNLRENSNFEKGCMTETAILSESALDFHESFKMLTTFFPDNSKESLKDIFEKCNQDLDWTMNILLDGGYKLSDSSNENSVLKEESTARTKQPAILSQSNPFEIPTKDYCPRLSECQSDESKLNNILPKNVRSTENYIKYTKKINIPFAASETLDSNVKRLTQKDGFKDLNLNKLKSPEKKLQNKTFQIDSSYKTEMVESLNDPSTACNIIQQFKIPDDYMVLKINKSFANELRRQFGLVDSNPNLAALEEENLCIKLPKEICKQIYVYWTQQLIEKFCTHELPALSDIVPNARAQILDSEMVVDNIKELQEDEELARKLQAEEEFYTYLNEDNVRDLPDNFKEITDIQKAIERSKNDILKDQENRNTYSSALTMQKLVEEFSHVNPRAVEEIFNNQGLNYEKSKTILTSKFGVSWKNETDIQNKDSIDDDFYFEVETPQIYRDEAQIHHRERKKALTKASEAARMGLKQVSEYYAQIANQHYEKFKNANERASKKILEAVNSDKGKNVLDLHMLHVSEALSATQSFLLQRKICMSKNNLRFLELNIITGRGVHSAGGESVLKPALRFFLKKEGYSFDEFTGNFKINLFSNPR